MFLTRSLDDLRRLFSEDLLLSVDDGTRVDVVAGGDGSLCQFLSCARDHNRDSVPLLVWPTGTINSIASDLGLRRSNVPRMIRALQAGRSWRSERRSTIDLVILDRKYSGFVFETGFISDILKQFYKQPNNRSHAFLFVLKTIGTLMNARGAAMRISEGETHLGVQSMFVSCIKRMVFGLRPFGHAPQLPTVAQFKLNRRQQRLGWWRLISGDVGKLIDQRGLILRPLLEDDLLNIATWEPINLDGEILFVGDDSVPANVEIRRGDGIEFILDVE